jgi:DNA polymerase III subunit delta'
VDAFDALPEQAEAKRLLRAALAEGPPAHAYLLHGPRGVGKRRAAFTFAGELLQDQRRVARRAHPDLYVLEPVGDQIRIDEIRELRRDLHMRPYEADRRLYVVLDADTMNDDAADALLKDLEEPPPYAVILLVANDLGPLPETIRSRCQPVPFRRLSERAVREALTAAAPDLPEEERLALARVAAGRLDRARALLDPAAARRRDAVIETARSVYGNADFEPAAAAAAVLAGAQERADEARRAAEVRIEALDLTTREADQRVRREARGAEREELLSALDELAAWYRDLVVVAAGAERAAVHCDRLEELREDATRERMLGAERAAELVRRTWRELEEFNLAAGLAFESLFVRLRRELAA